MPDEPEQSGQTPFEDPPPKKIFLENFNCRFMEHCGGIYTKCMNIKEYYRQKIDYFNNHYRNLLRYGKK